MQNEIKNLKGIITNILGVQAIHGTTLTENSQDILENIKDITEISEEITNLNIQQGRMKDTISDHAAKVSLTLDLQTLK